jgi:hypothetical protein
MSNIITLTDEQMKALQSGQSITIEPPKQVITKWEPKGGKYYIEPSNDWEVSNHSSMKNYRTAGLEYQTQTQAEQAAKALRSYARQLAYLAENDDGWVADWNDHRQIKTLIHFDSHTKIYGYLYSGKQVSPGTIYMSQANAEKLCQLLNCGIVEF